jgi:hypothetical protein
LRTGINGSGGAVTTNNDLVAFVGQTVVNQNRATLNANGSVSAYQMIDHLLDKIEELETRLANAGIA